MNKPVYRLLSGYSLDPGFSTRLDTAGINEIIYQVRWEDLRKGPSGTYFEVIDFDPPSNCYYDPVDLNAVEILAQNGLHASEGNPQFHQQFVYLIAMKTLDYFEESLGRKMIWTTKVDGKSTFVPQLRIYPHAIREANAFYDAEKKAVLFGYFEAASKIQGSNFPGGVIFTCLSPDIISHEVTHAILDSIHSRFIENTNADVPAFHEAFADIVALLQRFTIGPLVEHQIAKTRGNLSEFSFLGELATQFGNALQNGRGALRGAIGKTNEKGEWKKYDPDPTKYQTVYEPHERGSLLVATIFDAFIRLYNVMTEDLIRIATNGSGILEPGAIHPDLVKRLASIASEIAEHLLKICIRALDYCPPVDISYGDYLRALITADMDISPSDKNGYRIALIEAFRSWGIFPEKVNTLSAESLCWIKSYELTAEESQILKFIAQKLKHKMKTIIDMSLQETDNRSEIFNESQEIQKWLHDILLDDKKEILGPTEWSGFLKKLGLTDHPIQFMYEGRKIDSVTTPPLEVHKVRPVYRVGREGKLIEQVVITLTQTLRITDGELSGAKFRGGCTLILNMSKDYDVEYIIYKKIFSERRFTAQMDYQTGKSSESIALTDSMYTDEGTFDAINFAQLHFHTPS
jgi:hypothetical protein